VDGVPGEPFDSIAPPLFASDDGSVVAYAPRRGDRHYCVVGRDPGPSYQSGGTPVLGGDGSVVAYPASDGARWFAVRNRVAGPPWDGVSNVIFTPGGRRLAHAAEKGTQAFVVVDGGPGPVFERVTAPVFSGDGRVVVCGADRNGTWFLIASGREVPALGAVASVVLNEDGALAAHVVEEGRIRRAAEERSASWPMTGSLIRVPGSSGILCRARMVHGSDSGHASTRISPGGCCRCPPQNGVFNFR